eukprot:Lankesteria_metandrocarpae@DN4060_c0_g1_i1.p2
MADEYHKLKTLTQSLEQYGNESELNPSDDDKKFDAVDFEKFDVSDDAESHDSNEQDTKQGTTADDNLDGLEELERGWGGANLRFETRDLGCPPEELWRRLQEECKEIDADAEEPIRGREIWWETTIGQALLFALEDLMETNVILPEVSVRFLHAFGDSMTTLFPRLTSNLPRLRVQARIVEYRNLYGSWEFICSNFRVTSGLGGRKKTTYIGENVRVLAADDDALQRDMCRDQLQKRRDAEVRMRRRQRKVQTVAPRVAPRKHRGSPTRGQNVSLINATGKRPFGRQR